MSHEGVRSRPQNHSTELSVVNDLGGISNPVSLRHAEHVPGHTPHSNHHSFPLHGTTAAGNPPTSNSMMPPGPSASSLMPTQFEMDMTEGEGEEDQSPSGDEDASGQIRVQNANWEVDLHGVPAFLRKCYELVSNESVQDTQWSKDGLSFIIIDPAGFSKRVLPKAFKHNNFSSFVRQLNFYGFHKVTGNKDICEFRHEFFRRGAKHLLKMIKRNSHTSSKDALKRDKSDSEETEKLRNDVEILRREVSDMRKDLISLHQGLMNFQYTNHCQVEGLQYQISELRSVFQQNVGSVPISPQPQPRLLRQPSLGSNGHMVQAVVPTDDTESSESGHIHSHSQTQNHSHTTASSSQHPSQHHSHPHPHTHPHGHPHPQHHPHSHHGHFGIGGYHVQQGASPSPLAASNQDADEESASVQPAGQSHHGYHSHAHPQHAVERVTGHDTLPIGHGNHGNSHHDSPHSPHAHHPRDLERRIRDVHHHPTHQKHRVHDHRDV
eukprot:Rmarinus@m.908